MKLRRLWLPLCLCAGQAAGAEMYRWTDADKTVHYSQTPPSGRAYERVQQKVEAAEAPPPAPTGLDAASQEFLRQAEERETQARVQKKQKTERRALAAQNCEAGRARLQFLEERPPNRLVMRDDSGELTRMNADEWEKRKSEARAEIAASCTPP